MTGLELWAFGVLWLFAGIIVGAWLATREPQQPKRPYTRPELRQRVPR